MKDHSRDAATGISLPASGKLAYATPTLRKHGKVHLLTKGSGTKKNDAHTGKQFDF